METPTLRLVSKFVVELGPIREMGQGQSGMRRIIPILGGRAKGELEGEIQNVGADWQTVYDNGTAFLDTRYALETSDGALIEIINRGYRHGPKEIIDRLARGEDVPAGEYYMRTTAFLETGHPKYDWVNKTVFVGSGARNQQSVELDLYAVS